MPHYQIDNSETPIRLFKSDFMEFFTHITPVAVTIIWLPVAVIFMVLGIQNWPQAVSAALIPVAFLLGLFIWTLSEYVLHRFLFHLPPKTPAMERISYLFHGIHHHQPNCKTRLVMPPVVSIPLAAIFYFLFQGAATLFGASHWALPMLCGFTIGYLIYDLTHYATHHIPMRWGWYKYLKRYHMKHHYKTPEARFGVSSPLWDVVFRTKPTE